jgi:hypothetical protein
MDLVQLSEWIEFRLCSPCRQGYTCDEYGCDQATKIADLLKRMAPFKGTDSQGNAVTGWFMSE